ncbi:MAG: hypothetical protein IJ489_10695 [Clostridia bacterium]|nr:hypothetical protein [Clostridia bacterium]
MNEQKSYQNKCFSVLGDSISTLNGYTEPDYAAFYEGIVKFATNVFIPEDTWWGQVIERLGGFILVNNSFSGSTVTKRKGYEIESYGCSDERTSALSRDGVSPDVIMVFIGINDWGCRTKRLPTDDSEKDDISIFSVAYKTMLSKLKKNYPQAEIWCFTLPISAWSEKENFVFPYRDGEWHIQNYCETIRGCAEAQGCRVIDLYHYPIPYDTVDGAHPNAVGMKTLADAVIAQLDGEG